MSGSAIDAPEQLAADRVELMLGTALGPKVGELLRHPSCSEIMANSDGKIWIEMDGELQWTGECLNAQARHNVIMLVASSIGKVCNEAHPEVGARLMPSGSRFQGWIPPIAPGPGFVIRKRAARVLSLEDYIRAQVMTLGQARVLASAVAQRKNILVAGGTGSGKTTLTNALLGRLATLNERIMTIEDVAELECASPNREAFYTRPDFGTREIVRVLMRARPDRIIIGEVRDGGAHDLIKAWNTGHPGGIGTIHANSARDALDRMTDLVAEVAPPNPRVIAKTIHLIAFIERQATGRRLHELVVPTGYNDNEGYTFKVCDEP